MSATLSSLSLLFDIRKLCMVDIRGPALNCIFSEKFVPSAASSKERLTYRACASGRTGIRRFVFAERGVGVIDGSYGEANGVIEGVVTWRGKRDGAFGCG